MRAFTHVGALDLACTLTGYAVLGVLVEVVDLWVFGALTLVRVAVAAVALRRQLLPVLRWQHKERSDAHELLAVDRILAGAYRRFAIPYVGGWVLVVALSIFLGYADFPRPQPVAEVELLCGGVLAASCAVGLAALLRPVLDRVLLEVQRETGAALLARGLERARTGQSFARQILVTNLSYVGGTTLGLAGLIALERAVGVRAEAVAAQRGRAGEQALALRAGLLEPDALGADAALVDAEELPAALASAPGQGGVATYDATRELAVAAAPVDEGRWVLVEAEVEQPIDEMVLVILLLVPGVLVPAAIANAALERALSLPLAEIDEATRRVAEGGPLRELVRVVPRRHDELGGLASNFNRMLDALEQLARAVHSVAEGDLRVEIEGSGELQDAFRRMVERQHELGVQLRVTALELASASAEIQATTQEQESAVEQQSQSVLSVSDAVASLAEAADDISKIAAEVHDNAERALRTTDEMVEEIEALSAQTGSISELLELIREVADRSDLLALNGSLEATRAGEAGRGFALVANEMRRLAERVTGTVADVRRRISEIDATNTSTVAATERSRAIATSTVAAARKISTVTQAQSEETEQVSIKVFDVAEVMIATVEATRQTHSAAEGLRRQAAELERLTEVFQLRD